jgi:squalene-associated FAD-dependent desaturase
MSAGHERAVVVGGGLAGTSAALALADRGWDVTLLEARSRLGGAARSFERSGHPVDTGQHVLLRCYTAYRGLLARMGAESLAPVQPRLDIPVLRPGRPPLRLRRTGLLPAPLHLLATLARYAALSPGDRLRAARAVVALRALDYTDPRHDTETFGHWLRARGQSQQALDRLWGLFTVAALNIEVDRASLALAALVFRVGLLDEARAGDIAVPQVPLSTMHHTAATDLLDRTGVRRRVRCKVREVDSLGERFVVRTSDGEVEADRLVLAVPHEQASRLAPQEACPDRDRWASLGASAIVNVHVRYDRPVTDLGFAAAVDSPVPWFFDRTRAAGWDGQYLVTSVSAAGPLLDRSNGRLLDDQVRALGALLPGTAAARVVDGFVTREPRATFEQRAGTAALRPPPATRLPGLVLAGAWTATGWPDTLEGAVRSGTAAAVLLGAPGRAAYDQQSVRSR